MVGLGYMRTYPKQKKKKQSRNKANKMRDRDRKTEGQREDNSTADK